jgi:superfamily II DNA helicase RecQ
LPPRIPAATLSGGIPSSEMVTLVDDIVRGRIKVLFVSPEKLASPSFRRLIRGNYDPSTGQRTRQLPPISLLCVDEAHCLSQWGHNFRPSYLRLRSIVPLIRPQSILALTATAGPRVIDDICSTLGIPRNQVDTSMSSDSVRKDDEDGGEAEAQDEADVGVRVLNPNRTNIDVAACFLDSDGSRRVMVSRTQRRIVFFLLFSKSHPFLIAILSVACGHTLIVNSTGDQNAHETC